MNNLSWKKTDKCILFIFSLEEPTLLLCMYYCWNKGLTKSYRLGLCLWDTAEGKGLHRDDSKSRQESECSLVEWHWWELGGSHQCLWWELWPQWLKKNPKSQCVYSWGIPSHSSPIGDDTYTSRQPPSEESTDCLLKWIMSPGWVACCNCLIYNLKTSKQLTC